MQNRLINRLNYSILHILITRLDIEFHDGRNKAFMDDITVSLSTEIKLQSISSDVLFKDVNSYHAGSTN